MDALPLRAAEGVLILDAWVVPGANRTEIAGLHDGALKVRIAAPASEGRANAALVRFLRHELGCAVAIEAGAGSRRKRIRIESDDLAGIGKTLGFAPD